MYLLLLVLLGSCYRTYTVASQIHNIPKLCQLLFSRPRECPSPSFMKEDLICLIANETTPPSLTRNLGNSNSSKYTKEMTNASIGRSDNTTVNICTMHSGDSEYIVTEDNGLRFVTDDYLHKNVLKPTDDTSLLEDVGNMTLHQACSKGILCVVEYILSQGTEDINSRGWQGMTPAMMAARNGRKEVFDYLVAQGCDLLAVDDKGDNVLHKSCSGGSVDLVNRVISLDKLSIESKGYKGWTPIMYAAIGGHREVLDLLMGKGCNLTVVDDDMSNILHLVCGTGNTDMVKYIISLNRISIDSRDSHDFTPIMYATIGGHQEVFNLLMGKGCNLTLVDDKKSNILHLVCGTGNTDMVKYIISLNRISIDSRGLAGWTPIMYAAIGGHREVFDLLVGKGCNLTVVDDKKSNILHLVCGTGNINMVKYITSLNLTNIESRGLASQTPVMYAVEGGHREVFDLLVGKGCNLTVVDDHKSNIFHSACCLGNVNMVKYIISLNIISIDSRGFSGRTPVMYAVLYGHREVFDLLMGEGCNMTVVDDQKSNILHLACSKGNINMVKYIISLDIISSESRGLQDRTPMAFAVLGGHREVLHLLVSKGCDLSVLDETKNTILHMACYGGHASVVKYLMTLGVVKGMYNMQNKDGLTPEQMAKVGGHREVARLLKTIQQHQIH